MIKAKKGLLIALFAAMMTFAFGATSAFAAVTPDDFDWAPGFESAVVTDNGQTTTVMADWTFGSDGLTTATVSYGDPAVTSTRTFYDFNGATLKLSTAMSASDYKKLDGAKNSFKIIMKKPQGADGNDSATLDTSKDAWIATGYTAELSIGDVVDNKGTVDCAIYDKNTAHKHDGAAYPAKKGAVTQASVTVNSGVPSSANWYIIKDGKAVDISQSAGTAEAPAEGTWTYDGREYDVVAPVVAKYTFAAFQKWDAVSTTWVAADAIKIKDATDEAEQYRARYTANDPDGAVIYKYMNLTVNPATEVADPSYAWTPGNNLTTGRATYDYDVTAEQAANPASLIDFANGFNKAVWGDEDADIDTIKAFFADRYDVTVTKNKVDENLQNWEIEPKEITKAADIKAFNKKYETLIANYGLSTGTAANPVAAVLSSKSARGAAGWGNNDVRIVKVAGAIDPNTKVDDINFVNAPNVTYKAKKIKKKAKSFTVEAKAESGNAIKYSVDSPSSKITIDSATGKVTVAKGLKKGTYKVTVKAKTDAGNGYLACKAERQITIKVKK